MLSATPSRRTATPLPTSPATVTATPTPTREPLFAAVAAPFEERCSPFGIIGTEQLSQLSDGFSLFCRPTAGHEHRTEIRRYPTIAAAAAAAYAEACGDLPAIAFEDLPAAYGERPFHTTPGCSGFDCGLIRELVWQLDCWLVEMRSSDDTHFILTLNPIDLSRAILASAGDGMRARCAE